MSIQGKSSIINILLNEMKEKDDILDKMVQKIIGWMEVEINGAVKSAFISLSNWLFDLKCAQG